MTLDKVEAFIAACTASDRARAGEAARETAFAFDRLALDVFAHQYEHVPLYRRLCELRRVRPADVAHWSAIPAAPADLFKEADFEVDAGTDARTFVSSGTTQGTGRPSRHVVSARSYRLYRRSSMAHFAAMVTPDGPGPMSMLVLGPSAGTHPSSSLGHMVQFLVEELSAPAPGETAAGALPAAQPFDAQGHLDVDSAVAWLQDAAASTQPVLVFALRSALTAVFEVLRTRKLELRLPADSRLVETGGSKGGRTLSRNGILKAAWRFLHIPAYLCIGEYGMTELLSQFYDDAWRSRWSGGLSPRAKVGPPWTRTLVVDPATLAPVARGERGILRHIDLANCASVSAVQTLDVGIGLGNGFEVLGRAAGADARGCSQLMARMQDAGTGGDAGRTTQAIPATVEADEES